MANYKRKKRRGSNVCGICKPHKRARKSGSAKRSDKRTHKKPPPEDETAEIQRP